MFRRYMLLIPLLTLLFACTPTPGDGGISVTREPQGGGNHEMDEAVLGKNWYLAEMKIDGQIIQAVGSNTPTFIRFSSDEHLNGEGYLVHGNGGCNEFGGGYMGISGKIILKDVANTEMACPGMLEQEVHFFDLLYSGELRYELVGQQLLLHADAGGLLTFGQVEPETAVIISLRNVSEVDFSNVIISFPNRTQSYGDLPSGALSDAHEVGFAYRYAGVEVTINGEPFGLMPIDYMGEVPLRSGKYTYLLDFSDGDLRISLEEYNPIINRGEPQFDVDSIAVQLQSDPPVFTGQDSLFNELFQSDISDTWELNLNGENVTLYAFADASQAELAASTISPDGSLFTAPDGGPTIQVDFMVGTIPRYWLQNSTLIQYSDNDEETLHLLDGAFGERVVDAANPSSRHTDTPGQGMAGITIEGVTLQYDPYLAYEVSGGVVTEPDGSQYLLISLDADNFPLIFPPHIQVSTRETNLIDWMPADAARMEEVELAFQNGVGKRWLVQMGDGFGYFAEGKTADGQYSVTLMFPVTSAKNGYIPDLALLDDVFSSLDVTPSFE